MATQSSNPDLASDDLVIEPKKPLNTERIGELAEAAFLHKAVGLGFRVTKPWGDSERYDFVLDSGTRLWRVQIKCTAVERAGGYHIQPIHFVYGKNKVVYTGDEIDVLGRMLSRWMCGMWCRWRRWRRGRVCGFIRMMGARRRGLRSIVRRGICFVGMAAWVSVVWILWKMQLKSRFRNAWLCDVLCGSLVFSGVRFA
jgi:hypothetical protein